jgi:ribosome biogenesis protein SSF1/2
MKRVLLLNRHPASEDDEGTFILNFRHYAIVTKSVGLSRPLKRLNKAEKFLAAKPGKKGALPNLGKLNDISDFMIGGENGDGYMTDITSGSELDTDAEVEVVEDEPKKGYRPKKVDENGDEEERVAKRAVKLVELGPRMTLRLIKVEDGLCSGKILWHEHIQKTPEEVKELEQRWEKRRQEKEKRKKQQKENLAKKRAAKAKSGKGDEEEDEELDYYSGSDIDMDDYEDRDDQVEAMEAEE